MKKVWHLVHRFFGSLWPFGPAEDKAAWAQSQLNPDEWDLWRQMSRADRRHSIQVAQDVKLRLPDAEQSVIAAALLHDVGKTASGLGTYGRVVATLSGIVGGYDMAPAWSESSGFTRRVGLYLRHAELGADMLRLAGSEPLVVNWAGEHHLPRDKWTIDPAMGDVLKACDDD